MIRRLLPKAIASAVIVLVVPFLILVMMKLAPGDAASYVAGDNATPEQLAAIRERLNLNDPLFVRYAAWIAGLVGGDWGVSLVTDEMVLARISRAIPITASLTLVSIVITVTCGTAAGALAVRRPDGFVDRLVTLSSSLAIAAPSFWLGLVFALVFAVKLGWLPGVGYLPLSEGIGTWLRHLLLPGMALAALPASELARQLRASLLDESGRDYVLAARARGLSRPAVVYKHALKNAAVPVVTVLGFRLAQMVGGSVVVENVFAMRGLGTLTVQSAVQRDVTVLLGVVVIFTSVVVLINFVVDLSYGYFNPAVRAGAR